MNEANIIRALKICAAGDTKRCTSCPYDSLGCAFEQDVLDLIKYKNSELCNLRQEVYRLKTELEKKEGGTK